MLLVPRRLRQWDPGASGPELWNLYNGRIRRGEHVRVFPISNWTELDVWQYIADEELELPSIYFAHEREVFARDGMLYALSRLRRAACDGEEPFATSVRYRTVGDMSCTGAVRVDGGHARDRRGRDRRHAHHRARRDARRRPRVGGGDGRPQARGLLLDDDVATNGAGPTCWRHPRRPAAPRHRRLGRRRQVHADRPPALRLQGDLRRPARAAVEASRAGAATATSTSRCSPTACAPSASRASRSTSPTATSRRRSARSSSPTRPGHAQYTRNMVTGASTADLALVLVDARKGVARAVAPPRLHRRRCCGIPHLVVAVNKMDLVDYDRGRVRRHRARTSASFAARARRARRRPSSRSARCTATTSSSAPRACPGTTARRCSTTSSTSTSPPTATSTTPRFPVQYAIRPRDAATPTTAATRARSPAACCAPGDEVVVLPSGASHAHRRHRRPRRRRRRGLPAAVGHAAPGRRARRLAAATLIAAAGNRPAVGRELEAATCAGWPTRRCARATATLLKHTHAHRARARRRRSRHRIEVDDAQRDARRRRARAQRHRPRRAALVGAGDAPTPTRATAPPASFILVDEATNETVGAGMIVEAEAGGRALARRRLGAGALDARAALERARPRAARPSGSPACPASGQVDHRRRASRRACSRPGVPAYLLDGDNLRHGLNGDLGFAPRTAPRTCAAPPRPRACSPTPASSRSSRSSRPTRPTATPRARSTPATACPSSRSSSTRRWRSASGATPRACTPARAAGEISGFTGVDDPYERPDAPDVVIASDSVEDAVAKVLAELALAPPGGRGGPPRAGRGRRR